MNRTLPPRSAQRVRSSAEIPDPVTDELHRYDDHLRDVRGLAAGTRHNHCRIIAQLLRKKFAGGVVTMAKLRAVDVRRFIARQLGDSPSHSAAAQVATALRSYLRYRIVCGDSVAGLNAVISSPVQWKLASLPRALKPDEVQRLLGVFPNGRWPRRGYAIVRCALDMGLRAGEIANLLIDDIDWRDGTLTLKGTKSRRQDILPLPMATGQALADYLQHERPATQSRAIFVRQRDSRDIQITRWPVAWSSKVARSRRLPMSCVTVLWKPPGSTPSSTRQASPRSRCPGQGVNHEPAPKPAGQN